MKAIAVFEVKMIEGMKTEGNNRFVMGAMLRPFNSKLSEGVGKLADNGMVDVDDLRASINDGMKYGGDKFVVPIKFPDWARDWLEKIDVGMSDVTITKEEMDDFFDSILPSVSPSAIS